MPRTQDSECQPVSGTLIIGRSYDPSKPDGVNGNGRPIRLLFKNELQIGANGGLFLPVDTTIMGAGVGPVAGQNYTRTASAFLTSTAALPRGSATGRPSSGSPRLVNLSRLAIPTTRKARVSKTCPT